MGDEKPKRYDLEERTEKFAKEIIAFVKEVPRSIANNEIVKQLVRSAGSVGANYIEANEALSKKDFLHRIKICRKEAKESRYWLNLIEVAERQDDRRQQLRTEATELMKIFGAIVVKTEG